jgi:putative ABC transport system permease protein
MRQLAAESIPVVGLGALGGILLARWGIGVLPQFAPEGVPRIHEIALDGRVLAYVAAISLATVLLFSVAAVLQVRAGSHSISLSGTRGAGTAGHGALRSGLVVFEVAICLVLMIGVGLMVQSFANLARVDSGFDPEGLRTVKISLVDANYLYAGPEKIADFYRQLEDRLVASAGIEAAGATTLLPFDGGGVDLSPYAWETADGPVEWGSLSADYRTVTPGFLGTLGARFLAGRDFAATDALDTPLVVIVDEQLAERAWPGESAVGQRLQVERFVRGEWEPQWAQVVGVVEHLRQDPSGTVVEQLFQAHAQSPMRTMTLAIRASSDTASLARTVASAVRETDPLQPTQAIVPMGEYVGATLAPTRFAMTLLGLFAAVAVVLALVGTYGVISYTVTQRTRELGIQMALGATPGKVLAGVITSGARLAAAGLALGLLGALALSRALTGLLHGVAAVDPTTYVVVALLLGAVALGASYLPARRAARLDPVVALRGD